MSHEDTQIVALFEHPTDPMTVEDIVSATGLDEVAVKMSLAQYSKRYNKLEGTPALGAKEVFTEKDKVQAMHVMRNLMLSESPQVQYRSAKFIYNEILGRNDPKGSIKAVNINVNIINERLREIEEAEKRAMAQVIDIAPEHKELQMIDA